MTDPPPPGAGPDEAAPTEGGPPGDGRVRRGDWSFVWLPVLIVAVVVAVAASWVAEKTDISGTPGDVGHYCQQVAVINRTSPAVLGNGSPGNTEQAVMFVSELAALERVAPANVRPDVHEVRGAALDVYAALRVADPSDPASARALAMTVDRAETRSEDAIDQMQEYTQEVCGVDLGANAGTLTSTTTTTGPLSTTSTTPPTTAR